jgi:hypothetical protein
MLPWSSSLVLLVIAILYSTVSYAGRLDSSDMVTAEYDSTSAREYLNTTLPRHDACLPPGNAIILVTRSSLSTEGVIRR